jgi:hypothetical protein
MARPTKGPVSLRERRQTKAVQAVFVEDFPEITQLEARCRLCRLATERPTLLAKIHSLYRAEAGWPEIIDSANALFEEAQLPPITRSPVTRHFDLHVKYDAVTAAVQKALVDPREIDENNNSDYFEMWGLYGRIKNLLERIELEKLASDEISSYDVIVWVKVIAEGRAYLESLNKIRNSARLMAAILKGQTKLFAQRAAAPLIDELRDAVARLRAGSDPNDVADQLEVLLEEGLQALFQKAASDSLEQSCDQYKIRVH